MSYIEDLYQNYKNVRAQSLRLCRDLTAEDMQVQSMPDASPTKWHLGHTTWFFDAFILKPYSQNYRAFHPKFDYLFNSYYETAGARFARPQRGLLTRPSVQEVLDYRRSIDELMASLIKQGTPEVLKLVEVGLHHEMQHQELLLTDILHLFSHNPLEPHVINSPRSAVSKSTIASKMINVDDSMTTAGALEGNFSYDCERPNHSIYLTSHALSNRLITNREWLAFIEDNGYQQPLLWLSDGWAAVQRGHWEAPLYWRKQDDVWYQFELTGCHELDLDAPVCHVSYYEADAFARWAGKRLPREHELEYAVRQTDIKGNFVEQENWRPQACLPNDVVASNTIHQLYGDVWEWTQSAYLPYPKFSAEQGALGEYNGKFMSNQFVLKGGSCATSQQQMRASYRNFFYPHHRWQFSGLRLAEDL